VRELKFNLEIRKENDFTNVSFDVDLFHLKAHQPKQFGFLLALSKLTIVVSNKKNYSLTILFVAIPILRLLVYKLNNYFKRIC
jgi:hypothetical protein